MNSHSNIKRVSLITLTVMLMAASVAILSGCTGIFDRSVTVSGTAYPSRTEYIALKEYNSDDYSVFSEFKKLHTLDVTALDLSAGDYDNVRSQIDENVAIIWSVPLSGGSLPSNTSELTFTGNISEEDSFLIKYFTGLNYLSISRADVDNNLYTLITAAREVNPDIQIDCSAKAYGVTVKKDTELLDLNNIPVKSLDQLCLTIELFPNIKTIEMCDCGLSNEIMQGLRDEYSDIQFVWSISFLKFKIRTDIQVFSTLAGNYTRPGNTETFNPVFKYCTELRALDLGHMQITDISEIRHLKKLHTLILADNSISDISPLADLKELVYLEIFQNNISDVSPLTELPKLEDLNICYNRTMENPTVLTNCKKLKRLYISYCRLDHNEKNTLKNGIPEDCEFNFTAPNCVFSGWRNPDNLRNTKVREAFTNWRLVKEYPSWDTIIYKNVINK